MISFEPKMQITLIDDHNPFTTEEREQLWNQGVDLDDWDYALIVPAEELLKSQTEKNDSGETKYVYSPNNFNLEKMTQSQCGTTWYRVNLRGKEVGLGIVYH